MSIMLFLIGCDFYSHITPTVQSLVKIEATELKLDVVYLYILKGYPLRMKVHVSLTFELTAFEQ